MLGWDHIGITPSHSGLPGVVDFATARAIVASVGVAAVCIALSVNADLDAIVARVTAVQPGILHLCGLEAALPPAGVRALQARLPELCSWNYAEAIRSSLAALRTQR